MSRKRASVLLLVMLSLFAVLFVPASASGSVWAGIGYAYAVRGGTATGGLGIAGMGILEGAVWGAAFGSYGLVPGIGAGIVVGM